jgi:lysozyme
MHNIILAISFSLLFDITQQVQELEHPILVTPKIELEWDSYLIDKVKHFEGYSPRPYRCPAGVLTVGYGHTGKYRNRHVSESFAEKLLIDEIEEFGKIVDSVVNVPLKDHQRIALISFTYNCGKANLIRLVSGHNRLNSGNYESVERLLPRYRMANGRPLRGLVLRREWELKVWRGYFPIDRIKTRT